MGATLATVSAITKEVYGPRIADQMENEITLTKRIEKTSRGTSSEVGGKYVTFPLKVQRNNGLGYRAENQALQAAGQQGWQNVRVPLRYGYGRVRMTGQTMKLAETNYQAFSSAMTEEMDGLKTDLAKDTNRILWGDQTGKILTFGAATATTTIPVTAGFQYVEVGMILDLVDVETTTYPTAALLANGTARTITSYDKVNQTVTFGDGGGNVTTTAGDFAVRTGNYALEPHGLQSLVNNVSGTAIFNLTPATEPLWQSEIDTTGGALSESKMVAMCDRLRLNGGRPTAIFTDLGTRRAYFNLLTTQRRFTGTQTFDGGFKGLAFAYDDDIPVVTDVDAPAQQMFFLREDDFKIYQESDWHWEDTDEHVWKWVTGFDAFEALMKKYWEFAIERRNTQGKMTGITPG
jgi:hypothetical protein